MAWTYSLRQKQGFNKDLKNLKINFIRPHGEESLVKMTINQNELFDHQKWLVYFHCLLLIVWGLTKNVNTQHTRTLFNVILWEYNSLKT